MKKQKKMEISLAGGIGANVVDGDLPDAIRHWKQEVKKSNILVETFERREFIKPSIVKKNILNKAKYKQKRQTEANI